MLSFLNTFLWSQGGIKMHSFYYINTHINNLFNENLFKCGSLFVVNVVDRAVKESINFRCFIRALSQIKNGGL